jgi:hypothetical protein
MTDDGDGEDDAEEGATGGAALAIDFVVLLDDAAAEAEWRCCGF